MAAQTREPTLRKPLRLWPGVVIVALQWLAWLVVPMVASGIVAGYASVIGGFLGGLAVVVWWAFFSRAPGLERWGGVVLIIVALIATSRVIDVSIATAFQGLMFPIYAVPVLSLVFVAWAVIGGRLADGPRRASIVAAVLLACGAWTLLRIDGITGEGDPLFAWRWAETHEERLLARAGAPAVLSAPEAEERLAEGPGDWPGFRGAGRDGVVRGVRVATDWSASPPVELWRRPIGPGVSSFAVHGGLFYTQEQRGDEEVVACYDVTTGEPVWRHADAVRFWDSHAGAGPRATPTLSDGRVYTLGGTGILNALDARDGSVVWSRNAASDTGKKVPQWGIASSPLVVGRRVIVATAGILAAYDLDTGEPSWLGPKGGWGYSSPHLATIAGVPQVLLLNGAGAISVAPADGAVLWEHAWPGDGIVQPALTADGDVLVGSGSGINEANGIRRLAVAHGVGFWRVEERWTSLGLKPYFSDFVVHEGHAYGFDGSILASIGLADGERKWKGGRYGHGQLVLLADQDLLLVLSEKGELALVAATPDRFTELARFPAIAGKTWNHPALAGDVLLARNAEEMVALRLARASG